MHNLKDLSNSVGAADRSSTAFESARDTQSERVAHLENLVSSLEHRLAPVLDPDALDEDGSIDDSKPSESAPVIMNMRHTTNRIDATSDRLRALLGRLCI